MSAVVYDAAVLVAADRNERRAWAEHKARLEFGVIPLVPAPVVAQVSRSPQQAQLRRFLTGCAVVPLGESEAHEAGRLLGLTRTADVVDAVVVTTALRQKAMILTGDRVDMERLVALRPDVVVAWPAPGPGFGPELPPGLGRSDRESPVRLRTSSRPSVSLLAARASVKPFEEREPVCEHFVVIRMSREKSADH